jgi:hypothetical protein
MPTFQSDAQVLSYFPGFNENSSEGGDEYNSSLPDIIADNLFHGDFTTSLPDSLSNLTKKELEEFTNQLFKRYRFRNEINLAVTTQDEEISSVDPVFPNELSEVTLEGEENPLRTHDDALAITQYHRLAEARNRHWNERYTTLDGTSAYQLSTVWGAYDPYVEKLLEYMIDNGVSAMFSLLGHPLAGLAVEFFAQTPSIYTWVEHTVLADQRQVVRVWDASKFPEHVGYLNGQKFEVDQLDWAANQDVNAAFSIWAGNESVHYPTPYESPHFAYLSHINGELTGPPDLFSPKSYPALTYGVDGSGNELSQAEVNTILGDGAITPFENKRTP